MSEPIAGALLEKIGQLRSIRENILAQIREIDEICDRCGVLRFDGSRTVEPIASVVTSVQSVAAGRRKRGKFSKTGAQSLLDFFASHPEPISRAQILAHWKSEGRAGTPDSTLSRLVSSGQLERQRGSTRA